MVEYLIIMVRMIAFSHRLAEERRCTPEYAMSLMFDTRNGGE
jgi:hypothetical protein